MVAVLITDYERAVLDTLRTNEQLRRSINAMSWLPATPEYKQFIYDTYNNDLRKKKGIEPIDEATAAAELACHERAQEEFRISYKVKGYKEPHEYGKGKVKVLFESIKGGKGR